MSSRIAEGDRAADYRVKAAEDEAEEIVQLAQTEATRLRESARTESEQQKTAAASEALTVVGRAQEEADKTLADASPPPPKPRRTPSRTRAKCFARPARRPPMSVPRDSRSSPTYARWATLRLNAERLLRDVQLVYSRMVAQIDRTDGGLPPGARSGTPIRARRGTGGGEHAVLGARSAAGRPRRAGVHPARLSLAGRRRPARARSEAVRAANSRMIRERFGLLCTALSVNRNRRGGTRPS